MASIDGHYSPRQTQGRARVSVYVRARPLDGEEERQPLSSMKFISSNEIKISEKRQETVYRFDDVFAPTTSDDKVCSVVGDPLISTVLSGFNGSLMKYGQGVAGGVDSLTLHTVDSLFEEISAKRFECVVALSHLKIYKEKIYDLLDDDNEAAMDLHLREHPNEGMVVEGLSEYEVDSSEEVAQLLRHGTHQHTSMAESEANSVTYRSHFIAILTVRLSATPGERKTSCRRYDRATVADGSKAADQRGRSGTALTGKLFLCELAGSERITTGAEDKRFKEARFINSSLLELGNVIHALADARQPHVPFRNSILTRLMKECLGGESEACLMIYISSLEKDLRETKSSLNFGQRAMKVTEQPPAALGIDYKALSDFLDKKLADLESAYETERKSSLGIRGAWERSRTGSGSRIPVFRKNSNEFKTESPQSELKAANVSQTSRESKMPRSVRRGAGKQTSLRQRKGSIDAQSPLRSAETSPRRSTPSLSSVGTTTRLNTAEYHPPADECEQQQSQTRNDENSIGDGEALSQQRTRREEESISLSSESAENKSMEGDVFPRDQISYSQEGIPVEKRLTSSNSHPDEGGSDQMHSGFDIGEKQQNSTCNEVATSPLCSESIESTAEGPVIYDQRPCGGTHLRTTTSSELEAKDEQSTSTLNCGDVISTVDEISACSVEAEAASETSHEASKQYPHSTATANGEAYGDSCIESDPTQTDSCQMPQQSKEGGDRMQVVPEEIEGRDIPDLPTSEVVDCKDLEHPLVARQDASDKSSVSFPCHGRDLEVRLSLNTTASPHSSGEQEMVTAAKETSQKTLVEQTTPFDEYIADGRRASCTIQQQNNQLNQQDTADISTPSIPLASSTKQNRSPSTNLPRLLSSRHQSPAKKISHVERVPLSDSGPSNRRNGELGPSTPSNSAVVTGPPLQLRSTAVDGNINAASDVATPARCVVAERETSSIPRAASMASAIARQESNDEAARTGDLGTRLPTRRKNNSEQAAFKTRLTSPVLRVGASKQTALPKDSSREDDTSNAIVLSLDAPQSKDGTTSTNKIPFDPHGDSSIVNAIIVSIGLTDGSDAGPLSPQETASVLDNSDAMVKHLRSASPPEMQMTSVDQSVTAIKQQNNMIVKDNVSAEAETAGLLDCRHSDLGDVPLRRRDEDGGQDQPCGQQPRSNHSANRDALSQANASAAEQTKDLQVITTAEEEMEKETQAASLQCGMPPVRVHQEGSQLEDDWSELNDAPLTKEGSHYANRIDDAQPTVTTATDFVDSGFLVSGSAGGMQMEEAVSCLETGGEPGQRQTDPTQLSLDAAGQDYRHEGHETEATLLQHKQSNLSSHVMNEDQRVKEKKLVRERPAERKPSGIPSLLKHQQRLGQKEEHTDPLTSGAEPRSTLEKSTQETPSRSLPKELECGDSVWRLQADPKSKAAPDADRMATERQGDESSEVMTEGHAGKTKTSRVDQQSDLSSSKDSVHQQQPWKCLRDEQSTVTAEATEERLPLNEIKTLSICTENNDPVAMETSLPVLPEKTYKMKPYKLQRLSSSSISTIEDIKESNRQYKQQQQQLNSQHESTGGQIASPTATPATDMNHNHAIIKPISSNKSEICNAALQTTWKTSEQEDFPSALACDNAERQAKRSMCVSEADSRSFDSCQSKDSSMVIKRQASYNSQIEELQGATTKERQHQTEVQDATSAHSTDTEAELLQAVNQGVKIKAALTAVKAQYEYLLRELDDIPDMQQDAKEEMAKSKELLTSALDCKNDLEREIANARQQLAVVSSARDDEYRRSTGYQSGSDWTETSRERDSDLDWSDSDAKRRTAALWLSQAKDAAQLNHGKRAKHSQVSLNQRRISTASSNQSDVENGEAGSDYPLLGSYERRQQSTTESDPFSKRSSSPSDLRWIDRRSGLSRRNARRSEQLALSAIENAELKKELLLTKLEKTRLEAVLSSLMMRDYPVDVDQMSTDQQRGWSLSSIRGLTFQRQSIQSAISADDVTSLTEGTLNRRSPFKQEARRSRRGVHDCSTPIRQHRHEFINTTTDEEEAALMSPQRESVIAASRVQRQSACFSSNRCSGYSMTSSTFYDVSALQSPSFSPMTYDIDTPSMSSPSCISRQEYDCPTPSTQAKDTPARCSTSGASITDSASFASIVSPDSQEDTASDRGKRDNSLLRCLSFLKRRSHRRRSRQIEE